MLPAGDGCKGVRATAQLSPVKARQGADRMGCHIKGVEEIGGKKRIISTKGLHLHQEKVSRGCECV